MKKQAGKKLTFSTETLRALTSDNGLGQVVGGAPVTTAVTCGCTTTAIICSPTLRCTTGPTCG